MNLLTTEQLETLSGRLEPVDGFRVASMDVDFDPFDFARTGAGLVDRAVAYSMPDGNRLVGIGTAWRASSTGAERFSDLKASLDGVDLEGRRAFLGFSFTPNGPTSSDWDGFEAAELLIARITIEQFDGRGLLTVVIPDGDKPDDTFGLLASMRHPQWGPVVDLGDHTIRSDPTVTEWVTTVAHAVSAIARGDFEKVVLSRTVVVESTEPVEILRVFRELAQSYSHSYNFAWKAHDAVFMGASPELLVQVEGNKVHSNPLAGTTARGEGLAQDETLGDELLDSSKDRMEHAFVVDDVAARLRPITSELDVSSAPTLKRLATVQHLSSDVRGTLRDGLGVLDVIDTVHPTPAVGGVSRSEALDHIQSAELIDRGWYAGGIGWVNSSGDGEVCIALRCGLVRGRTTRLYAGAGIVADSLPDAELAETRIKFKPLLDVLTRN